MKKLNWKNFFIWWGTVAFVIIFILLCQYTKWFGLTMIGVGVILLIVGVSMELLNEQ